MYCANCRVEVTGTTGYCERCGTPLNSRLCPNGHIMDATWTECRYCSAAPAGGAGAKGRTVIETGAPAAAGGAAKGGTFIERGGGQGGGFTAGATLLDGGAGAVGGKGGTVHESQLPGKGQTVVEGPAGGRPKARTVFDSGNTATPAAARQLPRLVGWLVTFSHVGSGEDYKLREGRNIIGADTAECDVTIEGDSSISSKHAVIVYREAQLLIRDNDSTNGTCVNGVDIFGKGGVPIKNRDRIRLGKTDFVLYTLEQS